MIQNVNNPNAETPRTVVICRGVSGAGKSAFAKFLGGVICCADDFFMEDGKYNFDATKLKLAHEACRIKFEEAIRRGESRVVVANTNTQNWEFEPYMNFAKEHGYTVFSLIVENRHGGENVHGVPLEVLEKQAQRFHIKLK